jgi:hypothetical protein
VTHTWVSSEGGPLLVAPQSVLPLWTGTTVNDGPVETWGDYGRACSVEGDIGLIPVGERQGLVLGDQPALTTYLPSAWLFLRWVAADHEDELVTAALEALRHGVEWDEKVVWTVDGPVVLFDSAIPGAGLEPHNHLTVDMEPGQYTVRAAYHEDGPKWMVLVQFLART